MFLWHVQLLGAGLLVVAATAGSPGPTRRWGVELNNELGPHQVTFGRGGATGRPLGDCLEHKFSKWRCFAVGLMPPNWADSLSIKKVMKATLPR